MMTASMMRDRYIYYTKTEANKEQLDESELCICGYKLRKESDYLNKQNQLVSIMVCDSCEAVEHWVETCNGLLESE